MTTRELALAAHLLGVVFWIGGTVVAASMVAGADGESATLKAARKAIVAWATPGMLLAWAGGLTMLIPEFSARYASAGWMHAKLTLLVALTGATGVITGRLRKAAGGEKPLSTKLLGGLGYGLAIGAALALFLAVTKPF